MAGSRLSCAAFRQPRRWSFADCLFDEANWALTVAGKRVPMESKPLELLRELLLRAGNLVSKEELLDAVWPDVSVVEASLPTAVGKLRRALHDERRKRPIIQTVPRIGYRLAVPVTVEQLPPAPDVSPAVSQPIARTAPAEFVPKPVRTTALPSPRLLSISGTIAIALVLAGFALSPSPQLSATKSAQAYEPRDAAAALRRLDVGAIEQMIAAGWDPAAAWDKQGNDALGMLLNRCEWDAGHDRRQMLLMARTLIEGGAPIDRRNVWGDTAYSIAKAPRYCGPDHPVTQMLEAMCYGGSMGPKDLCLATYELTAEQRRRQGLPPRQAGPGRTSFSS